MSPNFVVGLLSIALVIVNVMITRRLSMPCFREPIDLTRRFNPDPGLLNPCPGTTTLLLLSMRCCRETLVMHARGFYRT